MIEIVLSQNEIPIRLTDERWSHITEEHCELAGMRLEVLENIANPFKILEGGDGETGMAQIAVQDYLKLIPTVKHSPKGYLWSSYDSEADVLYINFKKPSHATDSELTDDDIIIRYEGEAIVGLTILHASKR